LTDEPRTDKQVVPCASHAQTIVKVAQTVHERRIEISYMRYDIRGQQDTICVRRLATQGDGTRLDQGKSQGPKAMKANTTAVGRLSRYRIDGGTNHDGLAAPGPLFRLCHLNHALDRL